MGNSKKLEKTTLRGWAVHVARIGVRRGANRVFVGKREEKRPLGRLRRMWEDIIKIDLH